MRKCRAEGTIMNVPLNWFRCFRRGFLRQTLLSRKENVSDKMQDVMMRFSLCRLIS
jgi:hypothetical protein